MCLFSKNKKCLCSLVYSVMCIMVCVLFKHVGVRPCVTYMAITGRRLRVVYEYGINPSYCSLLNTMSAWLATKSGCSDIQLDGSHKGSCLLPVMLIYSSRDRDTGILSNSNTYVKKRSQILVTKNLSIDLSNVFKENYNQVWVIMRVHEFWTSTLIGHVNLLNRCGFCRNVCSWITCSFVNSKRWSQCLSVAVLVDSMLSTQSVMEKAFVVLLRMLPKITLTNIKTIIFKTTFPLQANRSGIPIGSPPELTQKLIYLL